MKISVSLLSLSFCCLASIAQPTSFGGITPGKTSREELKSLVQKSGDVGLKDFVITDLKQLEGQKVFVLLQNNVVYQVLTLSSISSELKQALFDKYGQPNVKIGAIKTVNCQNNFGATFERVEGSEELRWPVKDGVQGVIQRVAGKCSERIGETYVLSHIATVQVMEKKSKEKTSKELEEKLRKLGGAL